MSTSTKAKKANKKAAKKAATVKTAAKKKPVAPAGKTKGAKERTQKGSSTGLIKTRATTVTVGPSVDGLVPEARKIIGKMRTMGGRFSLAVLQYHHGVAADMVELRQKYGEKANSIFRQMSAVLGEMDYRDLSPKTLNAWANAAEAFSREFVEEVAQESAAKGFRLTWTHFVDAALLKESARINHIKRVVRESLTSNSAQLLLSGAGKKNKPRGGKTKPHKVPKDVNALLGKSRAIAIQFNNYGTAIKERVASLRPDEFDSEAARVTLDATLETLHETQKQLAAMLEALTRLPHGQPLDAAFTVEPADDSEEIDLTQPSVRPSNTPVTPSTARASERKPEDKSQLPPDDSDEELTDSVPQDEEATTVSDEFAVEDEFAEKDEFDVEDEFADDSDG